MTHAIALAHPGAADLDVIHDFLKDSYWSPGIPRDLVAHSCAHSLCAIARDEAGALIGFARLITDRATFGYVCDVFVLHPHQGKGIARALVRRFMTDPGLQGFKRWLLGTRDAHGVYAALGFAPVAVPERFMEVRDYDPYGRGSA